MNRLFIWFTKITGALPQWLLFHTKYYYEDRAVQSRRIKGPAIVICNHTSVFDYVVLLFAFFGRTLRCLMAELLFGKDRGALPGFLRMMGGVFVDRNAKDFSFLSECMDILDRGGVVCIFPESRIPRPEDKRPLPYSDTVAYLAHVSDAPVIPVFTNGVYFSFLKRARAIIGKPMHASDTWTEGLSDKENIVALTAHFRDNVTALGKKLDMSVTKDRQKTHKTYILFDFTKITAALPLWLWFRPKTVYASEDAKRKYHEGAIYIANHIGPTDPIILMLGIWYRRLHILAMRELFERPVMGWLLRAFHAIYVDRDNFHLGSFRDIISLLKAGKAVAMFPEGRIGEDSGTVSTFKTGVIMMAAAVNVPIIPMYIKKKTSFFQRQVIVIGEAVSVNGEGKKLPSLKKTEELAELLRSKELELINYA